MTGEEDTAPSHSLLVKELIEDDTLCSLNSTKTPLVGSCWRDRIQAGIEIHVINRDVIMIRNTSSETCGNGRSFPFGPEVWGPRGGGYYGMLLVTCYCLLAGGVLDLVGTAGGGVSVMFQGLPFPGVFQSLFVVAISLGLSAACGFFAVAGKSSALEGVYGCAAVVSVAAAAIVLLCAFSSLAYFGMFSLGE